jgi:hypothetical protein
MVGAEIGGLLVGVWTAVRIKQAMWGLALQLRKFGSIDFSTRDWHGSFECIVH